MRVVIDPHSLGAVMPRPKTGIFETALALSDIEELRRQMAHQVQFGPIRSPDAGLTQAEIDHLVQQAHIDAVAAARAHRLVDTGLTPEAVDAAKANARQVAGNHYKEMGVEPWDVVDTWPLEQRIGAYRHGALKYLMRMGSKDEQLQEIEKGIHYLEKLAEVLRTAKGASDE